MNKHTPTPMEARRDRLGGVYEIHGSNRLFAEVFGPNAKEHAAFIVRACNANGKLVEALSICANVLNESNGFEPTNAKRDAIAVASEALKLARGDNDGSR